MHRASLRGVTLVGVVVCASAASLAPQDSAPTTRTVRHVDSYHGLQVSDPYRWLEDLDSPEVQAWARAQDREARRWLEGAGQGAAATGLVEAMSAYRKVGDLVERGEYRFFLAIEPEASEPTLWVQHLRTGQRRPLVSPDASPTALVDYAPSPSGERLAYALAAPGERQYTWHFLNVVSGSPLSSLPARGRIATRSVADRNPWSADGARFYYVVEADAKGSPARIVRTHPGSPALPDVVVHEAAETHRCEAVASPDGAYLVVREWPRGAAGALWIYPLQDQRPRVRLDAGSDTSLEYVGNSRETFFFLSSGGTNSRVLRTDLSSDGATDLRPAVAAAAEPLDQAFLFGNHLVLVYSHRARQRIRVHALDGSLRHEVAIPDGLVWNLAMRHWSGFTGDRESRRMFIRSMGITSAGAIHALDLDAGSMRIEVPAGIPLALEDLATEQVTLRSGDGQSVPMFLTHRKGLRRDGSHPVLLFVYGAFGWTARPFINAKYASVLSLGGIHAMPNLRGGGIEGEAWHAAGRGARKGNTILDVIAAAEWLIAEGYTKPGRIALDANSAGSVAAVGALIRRPELFGAAVLEVPIADLLRATDLPGGQAWVDEVGAPVTRADADRLLELSPYHRVDARTCYPPTLITAGDLDTTAVPSHAYKLAAALQHANASCAQPSPVLLRVDWGSDHGANKPEPQRRAEWTAEVAFLARVLGLREARGARGRADGADCAAGVEVAFLANEGVALTGGGRSVLLDAFFAEGVKPYPTLPPDVRLRLESAAPPFDRVEWILVSHRHADHFAPESAASHLLANPRVRLASTRAVVDAIRPLLPDGGDGRLIAIVPPAHGSTKVVDTPGLRIEAFALTHGEGRDVDNLGFLVDLNGRTVLHLGDSEASGEEFAGAGLSRRHIDLGLVPLWYVFGDKWKGALDRLRGLGSVALFHFPARSYSEGFVARLGGWPGVFRSLSTRHPRFEALTETGQRFCVPESEPRAAAGEGRVRSF